MYIVGFYSMKMVCFVSSLLEEKKTTYFGIFFSLRENLCYEMDNTDISMFKILEPGAGGGGGGQLWANTSSNVS